MKWLPLSDQTPAMQCKASFYLHPNGITSRSVTLQLRASYTNANVSITYNNIQVSIHSVNNVPPTKLEVTHVNVFIICDTGASSGHIITWCDSREQVIVQDTCR